MLKRIKQQLRRALPWSLIGFSLLVARVGAGSYQARNLEMPGSLFLLNYVAFLTALGVWLERDNRHYRVFSAWDIGFFLYLGWVVLVPYYLVKTRGFKRALAIMAAWASAYIVADFVGIVIFI